MQRLPSTESQNAQAKTQELRLSGPPKNGSALYLRSTQYYVLLQQFTRPVNHHP